MKMSVHVRVLGVQTSGDPDYRDGMTVRDALVDAKAGDPPPNSTITVNNRRVDMDHRVKPNDLVVVTPRIKNG